MSETIYFANKCGGCTHYTGILPDGGKGGVYLFTSTSPVDCKLGVRSILINGCDCFNSFESCATCFYLNKSNMSCTRGHLIHNGPCTDHALKDYYISNQGVSHQRVNSGGCFILTLILTIIKIMVFLAILSAVLLAFS